MIILAGYVYVASAERDRYIAAFAHYTKRTRRAAGCLDVAISPDPVDATRVNIFELWDSKHHMERYRVQTVIPDSGVAIHGGKLQEFSIQSARNPFDLTERA
jgi:quinol monooxygenase YgiN